MKKFSNEWWFLLSGVAALAVGLGLRVLAPFQGDIMHFFEGLCLGLSLALLLGGMLKVRRDARRSSSRDSGPA